MRSVITTGYITSRLANGGVFVISEVSVTAETEEEFLEIIEDITTRSPNGIYPRECYDLTVKIEHPDSDFQGIPRTRDMIRIFDDRTRVGTVIDLKFEGPHNFDADLLEYWGNLNFKMSRISSLKGDSLFPEAPHLNVNHLELYDRNLERVKE